MILNKSFVRYDAETVRQMMLHDLRYERCPLCSNYAMRDRGTWSRGPNEGSPTMITFVSVCPTHSLVVLENDDWGGSTILYSSDGVKYA